MKHLAILISVIILKSCGSSQDVVNAVNSPVMTTKEIISGTYTLEQLDTTNIGDDLTLEFDPKTNRISGFAGCNRFFGTYSTNENTISLSELGATRMMCQEEVNKIEQKLFQTLAQINRFELSNGKLSLKKDEATLIIANESMMTKSKQRETINITYKATTRGFFETIWIEGDVLRYTNDRYLKEVYRHQLSQEQLSELMVIYDDLDVESIPGLEPPSTTFQYDAAAMATLEIKKDKHIYKTNVFDHGNPPKAISAFVNKVLSIKESIAKQ
jgi:heat shock protein HslJ